VLANHITSPSGDGSTDAQDTLLVHATPTYTHNALAELVRRGFVSCIVSQNVDALHQRAGTPRNRLSILHGCICEEMCDRCGCRYLRDYDVGTISFQKTGRKCEADACEGDLRDTLLDWEDALPESELALAERECSAADLVLALGTSLRIEPAGSLPLLGRDLCIVNLQTTPKNAKAVLVIHAKVDDVMQVIMEQGFGLHLSPDGATWEDCGT